MHRIDDEQFGIDGAHLLETVDAFGDGIESDLAFGCEIDLDDRRDGVIAEFLPVDEGVVAQDDFVLLQTLDVFFHFVLAFLEHGGDFADGAAGVVLQKFQEFAHDHFSFLARIRILAEFGLSSYNIKETL